MTLGLRLVSLSRRALSQCRATTTSVHSPSPLGTLEVLSKYTWFTHERSFSSGKSKSPGFFTDKRECSFLGATDPAADHIVVNGPGGKLQSVHWPDRPDVFGTIGADGLPSWVNWTRWPAVTQVVDQGNCDACWAHSTTASVEGLNSIRTHHRVKLSAQQIFDCCDSGGDPFDAMNYIIKNGGILAEAHYPYAPGVTIDDCVYLTNVNEQTLKLLVAQQPVTATIGADERFDEYTDGVLNGPNYSIRGMVKLKILHSVAIVGYGELDGRLFWLIKNSWSDDWGVLGFAFIARNIKRQGGAFGIAREISFPLKWSPNNPVVVAAGEMPSEEEMSSEEDVMSSEEDA